MVNPSELALYNNSQSLEQIVGTTYRQEIDFPQNGYDKFNLSIMSNGIDVAYRNCNFKPKENASGKTSFITTAKLVDGKLEQYNNIRYRGYGVPLWDRYNGMEDPRLIEWRGSQWCLFVRPNHQITRIFMVLLNLDNGSSFIIHDPLGRNFTKNWMPYVHEDNLYFVVDVSPLRVYRFDDGVMSLYHEHEFSIGNIIVHGGSNIIDFDGLRVGLVHGSFEVDGNWFYWHSVAQWSEEWMRMRLGKPFFFSEKTIEFSLCIQNINDKIVIPYSVRDENVTLVSLTHDQFRKLL